MEGVFKTLIIRRLLRELRFILTFEGQITKKQRMFRLWLYL